MPHPWHAVQQSDLSVQGPDHDFGCSVLELHDFCRSRTASPPQRRPRPGFGLSPSDCRSRCLLLLRGLVLRPLAFGQSDQVVNELDRIRLRGICRIVVEDDRLDLVILNTMTPG